MNNGKEKMPLRTHKRIWLASAGDFQWLSSGGHMIPDLCYWRPFSVLNTIDTDCPWSELRAIMRLIGVKPANIQTSRSRFDAE